jgi:hypothetical protein
MKTKIVVAFLACAALLGCEKDKPQNVAQASNANHEAMDHAQMGHAPSAGPTTPASSAVAMGTKHDPPITPDKVPAGHWYCDMGGSVHYSQTTEGNGKCALCSMKLIHKK